MRIDDALVDKMVFAERFDKEFLSFEGVPRPISESAENEKLAFGELNGPAVDQGYMEAWNKGRPAIGWATVISFSGPGIIMNCHSSTFSVGFS